MYVFLMENQQKAVFNEGMLQATRLNSIQDGINKVRINPLAFNLEQNCYNYQVWFYSLCSLLSEGTGKFSDTEVGELNSVQELIEKTLEFFPPHITIRNEVNNTKVTKVKAKNWDKIRKLLIIFEKQLRITLDEHGLTNPDVEGEGLF
jgi:hypothetical protein